MAGIAALDGAHRVGGALDRRLRHVGGMRIADRLVLDGAQPETLRGVVGRLLEPAVVERQHLGLAVFEKQFAVIGAVEAARDDLGKRGRSSPARSTREMGVSVIRELQPLWRRCAQYIRHARTVCSRGQDGRADAYLDTSS